ncbi:hypothetical protein PG993_004221 [Apiospora rasikravindrae]|uniref:Uncharacterized protein n=1 Tax=Apiospora rasikravindrae TaxID=990691 RepID=A0ABR1TCR2_9PEZI
MYAGDAEEDAASKKQENKTLAMSAVPRERHRSKVLETAVVAANENSFNARPGILKRPANEQIAVGLEMASAARDRSVGLIEGIHCDGDRPDLLNKVLVRVGEVGIGKRDKPYMVQKQSASNATDSGTSLARSLATAASACVPESCNTTLAF